MPINYYICTGTKPTHLNPYATATKNVGIKFMTQLSLGAFVFYWIRVYFYRSKLQEENQVSVLGSFEKNSLSDLSSNICMFVSMILAFTLIKRVNSVDPQALQEYPYYLYVYLLHLGIPNLLCFNQCLASFEIVSYYRLIYFL